MKGSVALKWWNEIEDEVNVIIKVGMKEEQAMR